MAHVTRSPVRGPRTPTLLHSRLVGRTGRPSPPDRWAFFWASFEPKKIGCPPLGHGLPKRGPSGSLDTQVAGSPRAERSSDPARGWLGSNARLRPGRRADNIANPRSAQELLGRTCEDTLRRTLEGLRSPHGREDQRLSFDPDRRATDVHTSLVMKHERRAWPAEPKFAARMHHRA